MRVPVLIALCLALLAPGAAHAATASVGTHAFRGVGFVNTAQFLADFNETNELTVTLEDSGNVVFTDAGAMVQAGEGCLQIGLNAARCAAPGLAAAAAYTRNGNDHVTISGNPGLYLDINTQAGDDSFTGSQHPESAVGGAGDDTLDGGGGNDTLLGYGGNDTIGGGAGDDNVSGDGNNLAGDSQGVHTDALDGGPGVDLVRYVERKIPVDVDLARATGNGAAGEDDRLSGFEQVRGGRGGGRLAGDAGPNLLDASRAIRATTVLIGHGGPDTLRGSTADEEMSGGYGRDLLRGGGGRDTLRAGPGADELQTRLEGQSLRSPWARSIDCGSGFDLLQHLRDHDLVPLSCERVQLGPVGVSPKLRRIGDEVDVRLTRTDPPNEVEFCRAVVALQGPNPQTAETPERRRIAIGAAPVFHGREVRVRLQLNAYGRELAARDPNLPVLVQAGDDPFCTGPPPNPNRPSFAAVVRNPD